MSNLLMAALGLFSAIPKPDIVSLDVGTIELGAGIAPNWPGTTLLPDLGASIGQARLYWGEKTALVAGIELLRFECAITPVTGLFGTSEVFMPELGISQMFKSERPVKSKGCTNLFKSESFVPRMDIVCGFSAINPVLSKIKGNPVNFSPTVRVEAKILLSRTLQLLFENRNMWSYDESYEYLNTYNTFHLSLCLSFGADYKSGKKGGDEKK
ncbi:hypothetical protein GX441_10240 [bacterium]|nr:hypothetical protein [bacterium]